MIGNKISIEIPDEVLQAAKEKLEELNVILKPYLQGVTPEQRIAIAKLGDKTISFVEKSIQYAEANPSLTPNFVDLYEWSRDLNGYKELTQLLRLSNQLSANLNDSAMLCGSDAYITSLGFYNSIKQAVKMNVPHAKVIYEDLQMRFPGRPTIKQLETV